MSGKGEVADGSTADDPSTDGSISECDMEALVDEIGFSLVESRKQWRKRRRAEASSLSIVDTPVSPPREGLTKEAGPTSYSRKLVLKENGNHIDANKISPVKIAKLLGNCLSKGVVKSVKPARDGGLWVTVNEEAGLLELNILTKLGDWEISTAPQRSPTTIGVIE